MAEPRRSRSFAELIAALLLVVIAIGTLAQSISGLAAFARGADVRDLAASIETGAAVDPAYLARFVADNGLGRPSNDCGDALTRSRLTVGLAAMAGAQKGGDWTRIDAAETDALEIAGRRLACNPLDGNAWLRYAMVEVDSSGPAPRAIEALKMSYRTAPDESWVIAARVPFATRLYLAGAAGFESAYLEDLARLGTFEPAEQVAAAYVDAAPRIRVLLHPVIAAQPESRRAAIVAEIDRLGLLFDAL
ncbi:MAG: hypothetical protein ABR970_04445 [Roseiarcus sp.]